MDNKSVFLSMHDWYIRLQILLQVPNLFLVSEKYDCCFNMLFPNFCYWNTILLAITWEIFLRWRKIFMLKNIPICFILTPSSVPIINHNYGKCNSLISIFLIEDFNKFRWKFNTWRYQPNLTSIASLGQG